MKNRFDVLWRGLSLPLLFSVAVSNCSVQPYVDKPADYNNPEGPGLFSGEKGYFLIGDASEGEDTIGKKRESESARKALVNDDGSEEFKAYQQWKNVDRFTEEYLEFKEWLRYQEWKRQKANQKDAY